MGLPYDALAMRYLRPLGHLSKNKKANASLQIVAKLQKESNSFKDVMLYLNKIFSCHKQNKMKNPGLN